MICGHGICGNRIYVHRMEHGGMGYVRIAYMWD